MKRARLIQLILLTAIAALTACGSGGEPPAPPASEEQVSNTPAGTREDPYRGHVFIEEIRAGELLIRHDAIPGAMPAMTMVFPIAEGVDIADLFEGDEIRFGLERVAPERHQIVSIERADDESRR